MTTKERTTPTLSFDIKDGDGNALTPAAMTLTLKDKKTGTVINSRNVQNVLNQNGVTVVAGHVEWQLTQADTTLLTAADATFRAWFDYTWGDGKRDHHAIEYVVVNEREVAP